MYPATKMTTVSIENGCINQPGTEVELEESGMYQY